MRHGWRRSAEPGALLASQRFHVGSVIHPSAPEVVRAHFSATEPVMGRANAPAGEQVLPAIATGRRSHGSAYTQVVELRDVLVHSRSWSLRTYRARDAALRHGPPGTALGSVFGARYAELAAEGVDSVGASEVASEPAIDVSNFGPTEIATNNMTTAMTNSVADLPCRLRLRPERLRVDLLATYPRLAMARYPPPVDEGCITVGLLGVPSRRA